MKHKIIGLFIAAGAISIHAQTITSGDIKPQISENYHQHNCLSPETTNPGSEGKSQTWDLSNLHYNSSQDHEILVMHPASTPYATAGASFAIRKFLVADSYSVGFAYFKDTNTGYYLFRDRGSVIETKYNIPEFIFKFPLVFGDSNTAAYKFSTSAFGTTYNYTATSRLRFDGTGTLILPDSTSITGVYRLKYSSKTIRADFNDTSFVTKYIWYKPGIHHPLAEYTEYTDANGLMYPSTKLYSPQNSASIDATENSNTIKVYPNPTSDLLYISSKDNICEITLRSLSGAVVFNRINMADPLCIIDTRALANDIYTIQIHKKQEVLSYKILVQH
jgi:hypothetical protein